MRTKLIMLPLLLCASPGLAQPAPQLPPELTDPAAMQKLATTFQALSRAVLDIRVGELQAAMEGREATRAEQNVTVGDLARRKDPDFERHLQEKVATVGPQIQHSMQAINRALPELMRDVDDAQRSLERAVSNLPDPNYPRR